MKDQAQVVITGGGIAGCSIVQIWKSYERSRKQH